MKMRRCLEHHNNADPKERHCPTWWWENGGDSKAGLASRCRFEDIEITDDPLSGKGARLDGRSDVSPEA